MADPTLSDVMAALATLTAIATDTRQLVRTTLAQELQMANVLDPLTAAVTAETAVEQSAIALINGLATQIQTLIANGATSAEVGALVTQIQNSSSALAAAVAANTPAAPAPAA